MHLRVNSLSLKINKFVVNFEKSSRSSRFKIGFILKKLFHFLRNQQNFLKIGPRSKKLAVFCFSPLLQNRQKLYHVHKSQEPLFDWHFWPGVILLVLLKNNFLQIKH